MSLILTKAQAKAVYSAMCAMNSVGGRLDKIELLGKGHSTIVGVGIYGRVVVERAAKTPELYADHSAFAAAYGLDGKEPRTAVYTAGIGWQVQDRHGRRGNFETEAEALTS
jgi:hypothetical protein